LVDPLRPHHIGFPSREADPGESVPPGDPERWKDLDEPATYSVGRDFARAIEWWEVEHRGDARGDATGRLVRLHMRRAHSHLYWTGAGRAVPRVRFLLPLSVKGGALVEEPEAPRERRFWPLVQLGFSVVYFQR